MDLLKSVLRPFALGCLVFLSACLLIDRALDETARRPSFPHRIHVEDEGMECWMCHAGAEDSAAAGMPTPDQCALCHEDMDTDKPAELQAGWYFEPDGAWRWPALAALGEELRFEHSVHAAAELVCADCHGEVGSSRDLSAARVLTKADCMGCHQERSAPNDCASCHREIDSNWVPPTHRQLWTQRHGQVVRAGATASMQRCDLCHSVPQSCNQCHQEEAPRNHGPFWRQRGHGLHAAMDRSNCATCHRSDFCIRCHEETRPLSHRGGFGSPQNQHCVGCHLPVQADESCSVCHRATPSHDLAAPLPADHSPGMNCRQCHGLSAPLPHPDQGDACIACHR